MKRAFGSFLSTLPFGARVFLLAYAVTLPLALATYFSPLSPLLVVYRGLALTPALIWKGQVWRLVSYAFLPGSVVDWAVSLFWLVTLVSILGRVWSARAFWGYCLMAALAGALPVALAMPEANGGFVTCSAMVFALLVAWDRLYRRERLILLGLGEISVRQAAVLVGIINTIILFFCAGWFITLSMLCGGVAGWVYLALRNKLLMAKTGRPIESERIARLEL